MISGKYLNATQRCGEKKYAFRVYLSEEIDYNEYVDIDRYQCTVLKTLFISKIVFHWLFKY